MQKGSNMDYVNKVKAIDAYCHYLTVDVNDLPNKRWLLHSLESDVYEESKRRGFGFSRIELSGLVAMWFDSLPNPSDGERKEEFFKNLVARQKKEYIENVDWNDEVEYCWPSFKEWLERYHLSDEEIEHIKDECDFNDLIIKAKELFYYQTTPEEFDLVRTSSWQVKKDWFSKKEEMWLLENHRDQGEYVRVDIDIVFYLDIKEIREYVAHNC